jgi:DNA mismatch endonuclease (patch repair protein)
LSKKAGHRSWKLTDGRVAGVHRGDVMSPEKRSALMSRIRGSNTGPETAVASALRRRGVYFATHAKELPGRPDFVFRRKRVAVFVDGDFWHGWRFPLWKHKLSRKWQEKIARTRERDQRNFRTLRARGWRVVRLWEHQVDRDLEVCIDRILQTIEECDARVT